MAPSSKTHLMGCFSFVSSVYFMKVFKNIYHQFLTDKSEPENERKTTDENRELKNPKL